MKHLRYLLMAALVAMPLTACDDDDDGDGVAPPAVGTVSGTVSAEGDGLAGVSVTLVGATSQSATTGSGGSFSFTNVEAGSYGVTISDIPSGVSFSTTAKTTSITTDGQTVTVDFSGSYIRTSTIAGQVVVDGDGIAGIAVTATGPEGTDDAVTDNGGNYSFSGLRAGDYTVAIDAPADYTFAATSYDITLGTGEAKTASFFGEMVVTEDPVTASVVIESVKDDDGDFVDPSDVYRDIYVTLGIDPGENDISRVCVLLDGVELPNGCQTFSSAVSDQELQTALAPTFAILTDDFDEETGVPFWFNGEHELSAKLELEGAMESSVVTSMVLTFDNDDQVLSYLTSEFAQVGGGAQWLGGILTVEILPTLYSGKELESIDWCFYFDGALSDCDDLDGPFPQTVTFDPEDTGWNFTTTDDLDSYFRVTTGLYADGSSGSFYDMALINDTDNTASNFDYEAPDWSGVFLQLPQQDPGNLLGLADEPCCSNNWVGPDFAPADGLTDIGVDAGVGIETAYFNVGTDLYTTSEVIIGTVALDGIMADAGVTQTFTNDQYEICAEAVDFFGNSSYICKTTNGNNTGDLFGFDDTAPTSQTVTAQPPMQVIYNIADDLAGGDLGGIVITASEDRSGFSGVPFRSYIQWWNADDTAYIMAQDVDDGGMVNLPSSLPSCVADGTGTPDTGVQACYPDYSSLDGVYYVTGSMNNQAGVQNATMVEGWVFNDQTPPEVTSNVTVPFNINVGEPMTFSGPVHDDLHLGTTAFGFRLTGSTDLFLPLGGNIVNSENDLDPWDGNFPTDETASITIDPAIVGVQLFGLAGVLKFDAVRATHTDAAGNVSDQQANNILATSVEDGTDFAPFTAWGIDVDATELCNGQGATACDTDGTEVESVDMDIVAQGPAGTFANPFLPGDVYIYLRVDDGDATITDGEDIYLIDILDGGDALITDEGAGGSRYYTWSYTLTKEQVSAFPAGTNYYFHVMGVKHSTGTALLDGTGTNNITIVDGS